MVNENSKPNRLGSIDALRGLVMVLMAIDHSRDFFFDLRINPEDPATTSIPLFLTRWITHFCAPTFVFLAGVSAYLYGRRCTNRWELSAFLFSRGAWLIFLEFTVVYFSIALSFTLLPWMFLVIAVIGTSMIALSLLCQLSSNQVGAVGIIILTLHNLLDVIPTEQLGVFRGVWLLLHAGPGYIPEWNMEVGYPIIPWIGVMAVGYWFGGLFDLDSKARQTAFVRIGLSCMVLFLVVRGLNTYGDPHPWQMSEPEVAEQVAAASTHDRDGTLTYGIMSFLLCTKYPPSLAFALMTLGPAILVLAYFDRLRPNHVILRALSVFGRVPLFFYVVHFYLLHIGAIATYWVLRGTPISPFQAVYTQTEENPISEKYGFDNLLLVYAAWAIVLLILFPACLGFGKLKRKGKSKLWSYL